MAPCDLILLLDLNVSGGVQHQSCNLICDQIWDTLPQLSYWRSQTALRRGAWWLQMSMWQSWAQTRTAFPEENLNSLKDGV